MGGAPKLAPSRLAIVASAVILLGCGSTSDYANSPAPPTTAEATAAVVASTISPVADSPMVVSAPVRVVEPIPVDGGLLRPVSKRHDLGAEYVPPDLVALPPSLVVHGYPERQLRAEAADALARMVDAAGSEGLQLRVVSAYRSYDEQVFVHQRLGERQGEAEARRRSAPPGHSEHQLGTTVDLSGLSVQWDLTRRLAEAPEGRWLAAHAHEYGFALSYPDGAEAVTGYVYEPWHLRYVGIAHASAWRDSGLTLLEYLEGLAKR